MPPPRRLQRLQQRDGREVGGVEDDVVHLVLVDGPVLVEEVLAGPVKHALGLPWDPGRADHGPPHHDGAVPGLPHPPHVDPERVEEERAVEAERPVEQLVLVEADIDVVGVAEDDVGAVDVVGELVGEEAGELLRGRARGASEQKGK